MDQFSVFTRCYEHIYKRVADHFGDPKAKAKCEFGAGRALIDEIDRFQADMFEFYKDSIVMTAM
jgi:hypothetical protein